MISIAPPCTPPEHTLPIVTFQNTPSAPAAAEAGEWEQIHRVGLGTREGGAETGRLEAKPPMPSWVSGGSPRMPPQMISITGQASGMRRVVRAANSCQWRDEYLRTS